MDSVMEGVYLIHFDRPYVSPNGAAVRRHYVGYSEDIPRRLVQHAAGTGARFMQVVTEARVPWRLARTWYGATRLDERHVKNMHNHAKYCPVCRAENRAKKGTN